MAMVCPQCNDAFDQQMECPTCGVRLLYDANPRRDDEGQWQQTPWGRIVVGLLLAQGLAHGLQLVAKAGLQATDAEGQDLWNTVAGVVLLYTLQGFSVLLGGTIAGAGQQRGIFYGSFVGLVNGLIFLLMQAVASAEDDLAVYAQPVLQLVFGALGGFLGRLIWKPLPVVRFQPLAEVAGRPGTPVSPSTVLSGPVSWVRVLAGLAIIVAGFVWSRTILAFIVDASEGKFVIESHFQARLITWEIYGLAALIGAGLAGATTANGIKHGLLTGLGAAFVIAGVYLGNPKAPLDITSYILPTLLVLAVVGGWFGSQLFPPLTIGPRRRRIRQA